MHKFRSGADQGGLVLLLVAMAATLALTTRDIASEAAVSLHGDMPRHMMNGVFLWDFLRSMAWLSPDGMLDYAREYFVRYPALSLGHHPPLLAALLVPFYAVAGVSVLAARLAMTLCMLVAATALYSLVRRLYGSTVAGWAALLLAVQPFLLPYGQSVLSEAPMVALVLATVDALLRFRLSGRTVHYAVFVILAVATLYAKQLAIFMFPTYALTLLIGTPWLVRRLFRPDIVVLTLIGAVLCIPIVVMTLVLSPHNVAVVAETTAADVDQIAATATETVVPSIISAQLSWPLLAAMGGGVLVAAFYRDHKILMVLFWIGMVISCVALLIGPWEAPRYAILAVPAYCICAAVLASAGPTWWRSLAMALLGLVVLSDGMRASAVRPIGAGGYEAAARYVIDAGNSPTVLYSASVDTGYFVFFVRKHDREGRQIVLRSDKLLTTSMMAELSVEERIDSPQAIYPLLDQYGTRFVVIEDHDTGSRPLDWLRRELHGERFAERRRFPIETRDRRLEGIDLVVYEYLDARLPALDAEVDVGLPIIGRDIRLRLGDLLDGS